MKKLLFVLAFTFIGGQAFSQIFLVEMHDYTGCASSERAVTTIDPTGIETQTCISYSVNGGGLVQLNQILNSVTSQGYKLISFTTNIAGGTLTYYVNGGDRLAHNATFIFAIP